MRAGEVQCLLRKSGLHLKEDVMRRADGDDGDGGDDDGHHDDGDHDDDHDGDDGDDDDDDVFVDPT